MATIVFIADGWGSHYGGINSFNHDICLNMYSALNLKEHCVICVTTGEILSDRDYEYAKEKGLLLVNIAKCDFISQKIVQKISEQNVQKPIWWIGHDIMTGFLATECAEISCGKCAVIHHMNYDAYYPYVSECPEDTDEKVQRQMRLFGKADVIFSVGPKLTKSANDILIKINKKLSVVELIPGIADICPIEKNLDQFSTIVFGRVSTGQRDIIKQAMLAVTSFAYANQKYEFSRNDPSIIIYGLNTEEVGQINSELREKSSNLAGRKVKVKGYPYTNKQEEIWNVLRCQSVCMMPSIHEGFGLAGWEAISAAVPLIISENSGLYEFLCQKKLQLKVCSLDVTGDWEKMHESTDVKRVADFLCKIKKNISAYKKNSIELRKSLILEGCTWENTALTLIKALGIESKGDSRIRDIMDTINEGFKATPEFHMPSQLQWTMILNEFYISRKYDDCYCAFADIANDMKKERAIKVLGIHCSTFCPEATNDIADLLLNDSSISVQLASANPSSDYLLDRLLTISNYRDNISEFRAHYKDLCKTANIFLERDRYNIRFFDYSPCFRLYLTSSHLYFSCYEKGVHARYEEVFRFNNDTETYNLFSEYYDYIWNNSSEELHTEIDDIPSDKRYLLLDSWSIKPSLVVNVCSKCNMNCKYCPDGGENLDLIPMEKYCDEQKISSFVKIFLEHNVNKVIRITGGEPLLPGKIQKRTEKILKSASKYEKIILCSNGVYIKEAYNKSIKLWEELKDKMLLKISLDTLDESYFSYITECKKELHSNIIEGIRFIRQKGFSIELNVVVREGNVHEIPNLFNFARRENLIGLKVLTVNDFGGRIDVTMCERNNVTNQLNEIMEQMRREGLREHDASLHDGAGIIMKRYHAKSYNNSDCTLTIVDHNVENGSITPRRTFCEFCRDCKYYPCATGVLNLTLRADGLLSQCRLITDNAVSINNMNNSKMRQTIQKMLIPFSKCFEKEDTL